MKFMIDGQILVKKHINDTKMALLFSQLSKTPPYGANQNLVFLAKKAEIGKITKCLYLSHLALK